MGVRRTGSSSGDALSVARTSPSALSVRASFDHAFSRLRTRQGPPAQARSQTAAHRLVFVIATWSSRTRRSRAFSRIDPDAASAMSDWTRFSRPNRRFWNFQSRIPCDCFGYQSVK